jgi:hypothetical protein
MQMLKDMTVAELIAAFLAAERARLEAVRFTAAQVPAGKRAA